MKPRRSSFAAPATWAVAIAASGISCYWPSSRPVSRRSTAARLHLSPEGASRMGNPLTPIVAWQGVVILDGGLATELEARGADLRDSLWSARTLLEAPEMIRQVHLDYFR